MAVFSLLGFRKDEIVKSYRGPFKSENVEGKWQNFLLFALYFLSFFVVCSLACRRKAPSEPDANAPEKAEAVEPTTSSDVAVTVNGVNIMEAEIEEIVAPWLARLAQQALNKPPEFIEQSKRLLRQQALAAIIAQRLLDEQIKDVNIVVTDEEVISWIKARASAQKPPLSLEDFKKRMEGFGQSFDDMKEQVRKGLLYEKFMESQGADKIKVTEEDANDYYSKNQKEYEQVRASHILIKPDISDPNTDPNQAKAAAKTQLQDLLKQINDGADFAELAKAHSACPSAADGGDLGFFKRRIMEPPFEKAAFELQVGQISDIVETTSGYHIIKVTGRKDSFEHFKEEIIHALTQKRLGEFARQYVESLKAKANIVYPPGKQPKPTGPIPPGGGGE
jgi:parvulin-like peptidyl-prolyl isomerase